MLYNHFHHFINIMDSDYTFLWLFAAVPDEPPLQCSHEQQPLPDSSWFVVDELTPLPRALCRPLAHAGRAPPRNDIDGHGDHGGPTDSNGPCHGRGGQQPCLIRHGSSSTN